MSWCRWSTQIGDKTTSDLYIYDSVDECVTVMVAGRRYANAKDNPHEYPSWELLKDDEFDKYDEQKDNYYNWLDNHGVWENTPSKYADKQFNFTDMDSMKAFLDEAKQDGLIFPQYVYEQLEEAREEYHA